MPADFPYDMDALLSVLNYLNIGVYIVNRDRQIMAWNRKAEQITGYAAADVVGRHCSDAILQHVDKDDHALCPSGFCPLYRSMELSKESDQPVLVYGLTAGGERIPMSVSVAPLTGPDGDVIGGIEAFRDESVALRDLEFAKRIQRNLLPDTLPKVDGFALDVRYYPRDLVGGDYYDARRLDDGRVSLIVADVTGHGVSAALYTMFLESLQDRHVDSAGDAAAFMSAINRDLSRFVVAESFATAVTMVLDPAAGTVTCCNAGHPSPLLLRADGEAHFVKSRSLPLGVYDDEDFETETVSIEPGGMLLAYTDGVTEAPAADGELIGDEGFARMVGEERARGPKNLIERLYRRIKHECGDIALPDDVLLLSVMREG